MSDELFYFEFKDKDISETKLGNDNKETMKDSIYEFDFFTNNEIKFIGVELILKLILRKKNIPKIYGFRTNKNNLCKPEKYNKNKKIDLLNYPQNSKHSIFYQNKNDLKSLTSKPYLILKNSNISIRRCIEYLESLFDSYTNMSFISSSNSIELIIIGQLNDDVFSENNIKYERTELKYVFNKILFILKFDYYSSIYNDGKTLVKISLKINFPDNIRYSSYFNLQIGNYINKYLKNNYDGNKIIRDIVNKYPKFIYINESKRKYYLFSIFNYKPKKKKTRTYYCFNNPVEKENEKREIEQIENNQPFYEEYDNFIDKLLSENTESQLTIIY
jgi:hypothetical protein